MIIDVLVMTPYWFFLCLGGVLLAAELLGTGGYALWSGFAAVIVGLIAFIFPQLSSSWLWFIFALLTLAIAYAWWKWSKAHKTTPSEPTSYLNERNKQLVGRHCTVIQAIKYGSGRVRVGDSSWSAKSAVDLPVGAQVKVISIDNITLIVEPILAKHSE